MTARLFSPPAFRDRGAWAMACGVVRSLEKRLLDDDRLGELLEEQHLEGVTSCLVRWGWLSRETAGRGLPPDALLEEALRESDRQLLALAGHSPCTTLFLMRYEMQNLTAVVKARNAGVDPPGLHPRGLSPLTVLERMAAGGAFAAYPEPLAVRLGERTAASGGAHFDTGEAVFSSWHETLLEAAGKEKSELLKDYLRHRTDLENIQHKARALRHPRLWGGVTLPEGGMLDANKIAAAGSTGELAGVLEKTVYGPFFARSLDGRKEVRSRRLQQEADDFLTAVMQPAKHVALGPEPLWGYYHARQVDAGNVRAVLLRAVFAGEDRSVRTLRRPYV